MAPYCKYFVCRVSSVQMQSDETVFCVKFLADLKYLLGLIL